MLCTQKQNQSKVDYLRAFQSTVDAINETGGTAGVTLCAIKLVCAEHNLRWDVATEADK